MNNINIGYALPSHSHMGVALPPPGCGFASPQPHGMFFCCPGPSPMVPTVAMVPMQMAAAPQVSIMMPSSPTLVTAVAPPPPPPPMPDSSDDGPNEEPPQEEPPQKVDIDTIPKVGLPDGYPGPILLARWGRRLRCRSKTQCPELVMELARRFEEAKSYTLSWTPKFTNFPPLVVPDGGCLPISTIDARIAELLLYDGTFADGLMSKNWPGMLIRAYPEFQKDNLNDMLKMLVLRCLRNRADSGGGVYDVREFCSGEGQLTFQCIGAGLQCVAFDRKYNTSHDMDRNIGVRVWLDAISESKAGSLDWMATQCSSFVSVNKINNKRSPANGHWGDVSREFVSRGNSQMVVTSLVYTVSRLCGNVPVLEQPTTSVMPKCQPLSSALLFFDSKKIVTWHGAFGGESAKALQLWSPSDAIRSLRRKRPPKTNQMARLVTKKDGKYTGVKAIMSRSQTYSPAFGKAVAEMVVSLLCYDDTE